MEQVQNITPTPRIANLPAMRLAGLMCRYPTTPEAMKGLAQQWQDFAQGPGGRLLAPGPVLYGVHAGLFGDGGEDSYFSGIEITVHEPLPAGLSEFHLPATAGAVIDHDGTAGEIPRSTGALMQWLPKSGHRLAQQRVFDLIERYGRGFDPQSGRGDIQLVVPIEG